MAQGEERGLAIGYGSISYPGLRCISQVLCLVPEDSGTSLSILKDGTHTEGLLGVHKLFPATGGWQWEWE